MLENIAFFRTKREKITGLSTLKVGGGENLLHVPTFLSVIVDYCMMAFRSSVHSSTEHTPFELLFVREMRIPLDVMMGSGPMNNKSSYSEFVADLQGGLEAAYRDVR